MVENVIETPRLSLRALTLDELRQVIDGSYPAIDPEAVTDSVRTAISKKIIRMEMVDVALHPWYTYWLIGERLSGIGIGFIGFKGFPGLNGCSEVGYGLSLNYRRRGLMTEALRAMRDWAGSCSRCRGITAKIARSNVASQAVVTHCHFQLAQGGAEELIFIHPFVRR
ncbi:MAG: GNAT family N-acetyltransferase [Sporolactobacillus sp.]